MTDINIILKKTVCAFSPLLCVEGIVLGGSQATGTATDASDIDIGIYYYKNCFDISDINAAAKKLDDEHRDGLICVEGGWGNWVNCGGWLVVDGVHVDIILREIDRVVKIVNQANTGGISAHYQTGHPHAYIDIMYRGELASSKLLYAASNNISSLKERAEKYPAKLKKALIDFFSFEADFSCGLAEKNAPGGDIYYVTGHLFRAASALNQVLFALNEKWCLNEKKAAVRIDTFKYHPENYSKRINSIFMNIGESLTVAACILRGLCDEVSDICAKHGRRGI